MNSLNASPEVSVIVPVGERHCQPEVLLQRYRDSLGGDSRDVEFIFVLDGPQPSFSAGLETLAARGEAFTTIALTRYFGEATCTMVGFEHAVAPVILILPAYFQIEGEDIPRLLAALDGADMAIAYRHPRAGGWLETSRRRAFHGLLGFVTRVRFHDLGCHARAMKRRVLEEIHLYGEQQRYLPILAERQGFRVREIQVRQSLQGPRRGAYRPTSYTRALLDIFNMFFLVRFTRKPLRFFGMVGLSVGLLGALELGYLVVERVVLHRPLADRPALMLASLFIVLGFQILALGLLGELIIFAHASGSRDYQVEQVVHYIEPPAGQETLSRALPMAIEA